MNSLGEVRAALKQAKREVGSRTPLLLLDDAGNVYEVADVYFDESSDRVWMKIAVKQPWA